MFFKQIFELERFCQQNLWVTNLLHLFRRNHYLWNRYLLFFLFVTRFCMSIHPKGCIEICTVICCNADNLKINFFNLVVSLLIYSYTFSSVLRYCFILIFTYLMLNAKFLMDIRNIIG